MENNNEQQRVGEAGVLVATLHKQCAKCEYVRGLRYTSCVLIYQSGCEETYGAMRTNQGQPNAMGERVDWQGRIPRGI